MIDDARPQVNPCPMMTKPGTPRNALEHGARVKGTSILQLPLDNGEKSVRRSRLFGSILANFEFVTFGTFFGPFLINFRDLLDRIVGLDSRKWPYLLCLFEN